MTKNHQNKKGGLMFNMNSKLFFLLCFILANSVVAQTNSSPFSDQLNKADGSASFTTYEQWLKNQGQNSNIGAGQNTGGLKPGVPGENPQIPTPPNSPGATLPGSQTPITTDFQILQATCPLVNTRLNVDLKNQALTLASQIQTFEMSRIFQPEYRKNCRYTAQIIPPHGKQIVILSTKLKGRAQVGFNENIKFSLSANLDNNHLIGELNLKTQGKKNYEIKSAGAPLLGICDSTIDVEIELSYLAQLAGSFSEIEKTNTSEITYILRDCK